jgi:GntR family transcriptional regulator
MLTRMQKGRRLKDAVATPHRNSGTTLSYQVYLLLRDDILNGRLEAGAQLPPEKDLAATRGVSRVTIRRALERLEREGLVRRSHGQGTFVEERVHPSAISGRLEAFVEQASWLTRNTDVALLSVGMMSAPPDVRRAMGLEPDEQVQRSVRLRSYRGVPCLLLETYLPAWLAAEIRTEDLARGSVQTAMRRAGIALSEVDYTVSAVSADVRLATLLDVPVATALLSMIWAFRDEVGRIVEYQYAYARPDTYVLRTTLRPPV